MAGVTRHAEDLAGHDDHQGTQQQPPSQGQVQPLDSREPQHGKEQAE